VFNTSSFGGLLRAIIAAIALSSAALTAVAHADDVGANDRGAAIVGGGRIGGSAFPGRSIGQDFAGLGLGGMRRDGRFLRDHLHHYGNVGTALGYYDGFSYGDECPLLEPEFRYRPEVCE
jgi:hypothetical protein